MQERLQESNYEQTIFPREIDSQCSQYAYVLEGRPAMSTPEREVWHLAGAAYSRVVLLGRKLGRVCNSRLKAGASSRSAAGARYTITKLLNVEKRACGQG